MRHTRIQYSVSKMYGLLSYQMPPLGDVDPRWSRIIYRGEYLSLKQVNTQTRQPSGFKNAPVITSMTMGRESAKNVRIATALIDTRERVREIQATKYSFLQQRVEGLQHKLDALLETKSRHYAEITRFVMGESREGAGALHDFTGLDELGVDDDETENVDYDLLLSESSPHSSIEGSVTSASSDMRSPVYSISGRSRPALLSGGSVLSAVNGVNRSSRVVRDMTPEERAKRRAEDIIAMCGEGYEYPTSHNDRCEASKGELSLSAAEAAAASRFDAQLLRQAVHDNFALWHREQVVINRMRSH